MEHQIANEKKQEEEKGTTKSNENWDLNSGEKLCEKVLNKEDKTAKHQKKKSSVRKRKKRKKRSRIKPKKKKRNYENLRKKD